MTAARAGDSVSLRRFPEWLGLESLQADYAQHHFSPHFHESSLIQLVDSGVDCFEVNGRLHTARAGEMVLLGPHQVHTGRPGGGGRLQYRSLYLPAGVFSRPDAAVAARFPDPVVGDRHLRQAFEAASACLRNREDRLKTDRALQALAKGMLRFSRRPPAPPTAAAGLWRARQHLDAHYARPQSIDRLAGVAGWSRSHFMREFSAAFGIPAHGYLICRRVLAAKARLARGASLIEAALGAGFADQSHFTRHFKRMVGLTPGEYRRSTIVQDGRRRSG